MTDILIVIFFCFSFLKEDLCAVIYHLGGQNTRNNGQPHRIGGCFSCLGRKVRVYKVTLTVTIIHELLLFTPNQSSVLIFTYNTQIKKIRCLPGTIFAPYPLSNAGSLLQLLDAMHSPQKAEIISSLERCGVFLISLRRKSSQSWATTCSTLSLILMWFSKVSFFW